MDFGAVGLDNLVYSNTESAKIGSFASESALETKKHKWTGSGILRADRTINEDDFREFKMAKTCDGMLKIPLQMCNNSSFIEGQQMLSFSSPNSLCRSSTGYESAEIAGGSVHGVLLGVRGPFTPSQWMELEHQALIYKYITANVPIPSYLLNPIRKALESAGFSTFSGLRSNSLVGWGGFHLGFSSTDPEPGRCRRTDGKKWRCSRDAVADQKYCERHMNRGRHRSRKPVEGQPGHSASGITTANGKLTPTSSSTSVSVVPSGGVSNSLSHHQLNNLQPGMSNIKRDSKSEGRVNYWNSGILNHKDHKSQHLLRQFMDDRPKNQSEHRSSVSWPDTDLQPDRTQLSISIPVGTSDFIPQTCDKLQNSQERQGTETGGSLTSDQNRRETNWIPVSWEPSMGGPLGEVLNATSNSTVECKNAMALNLMDSWGNNTRLASSPTGVLQKGAFGSVSNSSAGSSPRAESGVVPGIPGLTNRNCDAITKLA